MYHSWQVAIKFINYYLNASNGKGHGIHSPFIFQFIRDVLNDREEYEEYRTVEKLRTKLIADRNLVSVQDFGAGSAKTQQEKRSISSIARHAAKSKKYGQLLFRIARKYQPQ